MTANAFAEDVQLAKNTGMNEHIAKPLDLNKLNDVLKQWLWSVHCSKARDTGWHKALSGQTGTARFKIVHQKYVGTFYTVTIQKTEERYFAMIYKKRYGQPFDTESVVGLSLIHI